MFNIINILWLLEMCFSITIIYLQGKEIKKLKYTDLDLQIENKVKLLKDIEEQIKRSKEDLDLIEDNKFKILKFKVLEEKKHEDKENE